MLLRALPFLVAGLAVGCSSSHSPDGGGLVPDGDGGFVRRDSGTSTRDGGGGTVIDSGTTPRDGGGTTVVDAGIDVIDECVAVCEHLVACGADVGTETDCVGGCIDAEAVLSSPGCTEIFLRISDCLSGLSCPELRGRDPGRTACAPLFDDFETMCGGGGGGMSGGGGGSGGRP